MINVGDLLAILRLQDEMTPALKTAVSGLDEVNKAVDVVQKRLKQMDGDVQASAFQLTLLGRGLREAGAIATTLFTVPILASAEAVVKFGGEFESQMTKVITLAGASREEVDGLRDRVLALGPAVGVGPAKLADGLFVLESYGLRGAEAMETLTVAAKMTALGMGTTEETARGLTGVLFAYRNQNITAAEAGDILTRTVQLGNMRISELVPALAKVNPVAAAMGIKFQDVAAAIATFTHAGVDSSLAATGLRAILNSILTDSVKTEKGFRALSAALGDQTITMANFRKEIVEKGLSQAMVDLANNVTKAGDAGVTAFGQIIPNIRGLTEALAVFQQNGGMVIDTLDGVNTATGVIDRSTVELQKTWSGQWKMMQAEVEKMWIQLSDAGLLDVFKRLLAVMKDDVLPVLEEMISAFKSLPAPVQDAILIFTALLALLGPFLIIAGQMVMAVGNIARALPAVSAGITYITTAITALAGSEAMTTVLAFLSGPWGIAAISIAAVGAAFYHMKTQMDDTIRGYEAQAQHQKDLTTITKAFGQETALTADAQKELAAAMERVNKAGKTDNTPATNLGGFNTFGLSLDDKGGIKQNRAQAIIQETIATQSLLEKVSALTSLQRAEIDSLQAQKLSTTEIATEMLKYADNLGITAEVIGVYERQTKAATVANHTLGTQEVKLAKETAENVTATQRLWDEYYEVLAQNEGDSLATRTAGIQRWYDKEEGLIKQMSALGVDTTERQIALDKTKTEKLLQSQNTQLAHEQEVKNQIDSMWSEYYKAIDTASGDTLQAQLDQIDVWYKSNYNAIMKASKVNADELTRLDSLNATYYAKRAQRIAADTKAHTDSTAQIKSLDERYTTDTEALWERYYSIIDQTAGNSEKSQIDNARRQALKLEKINQEHYDAMLLTIRNAKGLEDTERSAENARALLDYKNQDAAIQAILKAQIAAIKAANNQVGQLAISITNDIVSGIKSGNVRDTVTSIVGNVGSAIGKGIGTAIGGPIGGAIGSAIGSLASMFVNWFSTPVWQQMQQSVGTEWGIHISDALGKQLEEDANRLGSTEAAKIFNLKALIDAGGGLDASNFVFLSGKLRDTFVDLGQHFLTTAEAAKVLNDNFDNFVKTGTDSVGLLDPAIVEIQKLNDEFKTGSEAIAAYQKTQIASASTGIAAALKVTDDAYTTSADLRKKIADDQLKINKILADAPTDKALDPGTASEMADITKEMIDLNKQLEIQQNIINVTGLHSQAAADGVAGSIIAIVDANMKAGDSFITAVRGVAPAVTALEKQLQTAGLDGGAAFEFIRKEVDLANDAVAGPALTAVEGFTSAIVGLSNVGMLTQDTFGGLASQITDTYNSLIALGKDPQTVLVAMAPDLQVLWEESKKFGLTLDDNTQALIDQGLAAGLVGPAHKSSTQQMIDALNHMSDVLDKIANKWGVVSDNIDDANKSIGDVQTTVANHHGILPGDQPSDQGGNGNDLGLTPFARGGIVTRPTRALIGEAGPEGVFPLGRDGSLGTSTVIIEMDGRQMAKVVVPFIPGEIKRAGIYR